MSDQPQETRPLVLYVERVAEAAIDPTPHVNPITAMDVELSAQNVEELLSLLTTRAESGVPGAIRFRLYGHLVIA